MDELNSVVDDMLPSDSELMNIPGHSQAVERHVKLVTEASSAVYGTARRDGFIRAQLESCSTMSVFNTKSDYKKFKPRYGGWLGWVRAELDMQPPPRGEFWVIIIMLIYWAKLAESCNYTSANHPIK